jgi:S-adenosylmethionine hydrolase
VGALITFLSDYGYRDEFVGVCHGVIARRCPTARIIDLSHGVPRHDVRAGALMLRAALPYTPPGIHLAVVDPGVGTARRAVALAVEEQPRILVGPDNGLLMAAAATFGGVQDGVEISNSRERLEPTSATFHGRDIFAPVAAALAAGVPLHEVGEPIAPDGLATLQLPEARVENNTLLTHVLTIDGYGNVGLDATAELAAKVGINEASGLIVEASGMQTPAQLGSTLAAGPAATLLVYRDARGALALAVNRGSGAAQLALGLDDELRLRPR